MPQLYLPPVAHGAYYYQLAQLAAFGLFVGLLLGQGYRRGYPWRQWLPLVAAATLALMLGCQLVFLPTGEWLAWLRGDAAVAHALAHGPRSVVGGAAASLLVVLVLRRALGFRGWAVLDAFAGPLCWALAVQCVGCALVGCCWGEVAAPGTLGVSFGPGTLPYLAQQAQGLLPAGAAHALPVVPTQLYQLLLCGGVGLGLHALRHRAASWPGGSRYLLAMSLLCLGRLGIEFWRDPAGEPLLSASLAVAGFSLLKIQWLLLLEGLALLGGWAWLVRRRAVAASPYLVPVPAIHSALVALGLLGLTAHFGSGLLAASEVLTLQLLLLLVLLAEARTWLPRLSWALPRLAGVPLAALLGAGLLLATAQAPAPQQNPPAPDQAATSHFTLSGGLLGNYHDADETYANNPGSCGGSTRYNTYQQVRAGGGEAAYTRTNAAVQTTVGAGIWLGTQHIGVHLPAYNAPFTVHADTTLSYNLADVHFYVEQERQIPNIGFAVAYRLGLHAGSLGHYSYYTDTHSRDNNTFAPEGMLRVGFPRVAYLQGDVGYGAENALGAYTTRLALGSGLGQLHGSQLLVGYANSAHYPSPNLAFASANLRLPASTGLGALSLEPYFATDFDRHNIFSLKLHYQLGR
ncbi:prolipoprotein diacylglyceryl transferase family protein [Hymenobacter cheonanensis]|uniref:prolipoprotein diacylglyceryl transferase family protein n=1 Tax=Hymenobacter sp. CA2-7 TaxID=3063993 RepID=UPI00271449D2|nr:prolipoprotein diacylglyceryl transferase family protein [Hymenobacter sp. CA2-7]MDO7886697.1 prolipoprotein diacylglyceryl transferase [Hymenobacter sp. CA2-7]